MSKTKPILNTNWQVETFVLAKMLTEKARVLFIYNEDFDRIEQLKTELKISPTIMNDDIDSLERARQFGFDIIFGNINSNNFTEIPDKSFDYIVCENVLQTARYPLDFLKDVLTKTDNLILCNKNQAFWKKRLKFLFFGSHYIKNPYEVVPDDKYAWFNRSPWLLSHKDVIHLCSCLSFTILKGITIYRNGILNNMYDLRNSPNWSADKVYYLITNNKTQKPIYKIENAVS